MRTWFIIWLIIVGNTELLSQNLQGIWISSHSISYHIATDSDSLDESQSDHSKDLEPMPSLPKYFDADTVYSSAFALIDFLDQENVLFKSLFVKNDYISSYRVLEDTVFATLDSVEVKMILLDNTLTLLDEELEFKKTHFVFERLIPKGSLESNTSLFLSNHKNSLSFVHDQKEYESHFIFLDSIRVIINSFYKDGYAMTSPGEYKLTNYEGNTFIYIRDYQNMTKNVYRIFEYSNEGFSATTFVDLETTPPLKHNLSVNVISPINKKQRRKLKRMLAGNWLLGDSEVPFNSRISDFDSLEDQFYELTIDKRGKYKISHGGVLIKENESVNGRVEKTGTWSLGYNGRYIELQEKDGYRNFLTIIELSNSEFSLRMDIQQIEPKAYLGNRLLKLRKK